jgi:DNA-binding response OmpR family regulator
VALEVVLGDLAGLRILVVEDEWLLAFELADLLRAQGCEIVGPAPSVDVALRLIATQEMDAAVLDANLRGQPATPVACALRRNEVEFLLLTAYSEADLRDGPLAGAPRLPKPLQPDVVCARLKEVAGHRKGSNIARSSPPAKPDGGSRA